MVSLPTWLVFAALAAPADVEVVKFTASWCGPCQAMEPVLEEVAARGYPVRRIDVDQRRDLAQQHDVKNLPTLLIVSEGRVVDRVEGAMPLEPLLARLAQFNATAPAAPVAGPTVPLQPTAQRRAEADHWSPQSPPPDTGPSTASDATSSFEQLALQATVRLRVEDAQGHSFGTGTIVDAHGQDALVLTCGHIFRDSEGRGKIQVELFAPGATEPVVGELIRYDLERDLALVGVRSPIKIVPIPIARPSDRVAMGQTMFSVGCNNGADPTVMRGQLTAVNKYLGPANLTVAGRPTEGRSGGGLFTYDGYLVGVCNAADPEIEEGLYASYESIHRHLDDAKLAFVYQGSVDNGVRLANATGPTAARASQPAGSDQRQQGPEPATLGRGLGTFPEQLPSRASTSKSEETEVICIIRRRSQPASESQVVVLERPSRDFLSQLTEESRVQSSRQMTGHRVYRKPAATDNRTLEPVKPRRLQLPIGAR